MLAVPAERIAHELAQRGGERLAGRPVGEDEDPAAQRITLGGHVLERPFDGCAARLSGEGERPYTLLQEGQARVADRAWVGGDCVRDRKDGVAELDAVAEAAALEHMLSDEELEAVLRADAVELDRPARPFAFQAELVPGPDPRQPASGAPAIDRVELGQAQARDRVVPAHEEGDRVGECEDVVTASRHGCSEGLVAVARPEGPLLFRKQLTGVEREVGPTLGQRRPCGAGATDEGVYPDQ